MSSAGYGTISGYAGRLSAWHKPRRDEGSPFGEYCGYIKHVLQLTTPFRYA